MEQQQPAHPAIKHNYLKSPFPTLERAASGCFGFCGWGCKGVQML